MEITDLTFMYTNVSCSWTSENLLEPDLEDDWNQIILYILGPSAPPPTVPTFPDLPTVPTNSLPVNPPGSSSAGGEDVDFDDLTRRFEDLKKKK